MSTIRLTSHLGVGRSQRWPGEVRLPRCIPAAGPARLAFETGTEGDRQRRYVLSRDRLLEIVRGDDSVVAGRIVDTYVRRLRRKLEAIDPAFDRIETVIGAGYRYKD